MTEAPARSAWAAMRALVLDLHDHGDAIVDGTGLSYQRAKALRLLLDGPSSMRDLASALSTDASYMTVMVNDLEKRGLVKRFANPTDRRSKLVRITNSGRKVAKQVNRIESDPPPALKRLDPARLDDFESVLVELVRASTRSS